MRAYSMDLRIRVLKACDSGLGTTEVAELFDVSTAWIRRLKQRRRETGQIGAREQRHGPLPKLHGHEEELVRIVEEQPDRTAKGNRGITSALHRIKPSTALFVV
ncbi:MAG: helix-turn-helix domain-containing protein [Pirellulaceae bacterium]|nr:helix-turn-helix domain-containing protein [Pirellulaceae bacterium]